MRTFYTQIRADVEAIARRCDRDPASITLVTVTKTHPLEDILPVYDAGCRDFGESRLQEALEKIPQAPQDIRWHFIGTLQSNKVRKAISRFALIHSVDSVELAAKISQISVEMGMTTPILLQANTSGEASKHGLPPDQWKQAFESLLALPGIDIQGLMVMAPLTEDESVIRRCFSELRYLRDELASYPGISSSFRHLSMGMSYDYPIAIEEGATLLRIGSAIFE